MKKGLMMAIAASTVLFAGGDIAPVQPVAEAPAAACNDFYGHAGVGVVYNDPDTNATKDQTVTWGAVAVLGVNKEIFSGVTFNAEVQGGFFGNKVGDANATYTKVGGLTQFNLGYTFCNTAIKVGRFAIPANLSPLINTGTDYFGLKRKTYDGVLVANTDLPDTTVWASYIYHIANHANTIDGLGLTQAQMGTKTSVIAAGFRNTSFADTVITLAGYYDAGTDERALPWTYKVAGSIDHKWCDTDLSVGGAYQKMDDNSSAYVVGGMVTQAFGAASLTLGATYGDMGYAKYTDLTNQDTNGTNTWAIGAKLGTDWCGYKLGAFGNYRQDKTYQVGASVAKTVSGINLAADIRYQHAGVTEVNSMRIRAKAVYKF